MQNQIVGSNKFYVFGNEGRNFLLSEKQFHFKFSKGVKDGCICVGWVKVG